MVLALLMGGYIYVAKTGGGNITISVSTGWGSVGVSVPFGKTVSVGGYSVWRLLGSTLRLSNMLLTPVNPTPFGTQIHTGSAPFTNVQSPRQCIATSSVVCK